MLKLKDKNKVINFTLTKKNEKVSSKEDYNSYINKVSEENIIFPKDEEITLFYPEDNFNIIPFYKTNNSDFLSFNTYTSILYNENELKYINDNLKTSYYIFSIYDNYDSNNQKLLNQFKINAGEKGTYNIVNQLITPRLKYFNNQGLTKSFNVLPIPIDKLKNNTIYLKIVFFNSKNGLFTYFNNSSQILTTEEKNYITTIINPINKTYTFNSNTIEITQSSIKDSFIYENNKLNTNKNTLSPLNDSNDDISFGIDNILKKFKI
jgi:hypothetical protein